MVIVTCCRVTTGDDQSLENTHRHTPHADTPAQAVRDERAHLLAYGANMTVYCRRLQAIANAVGARWHAWSVLDMDSAGSIRVQPGPRPHRFAIPFDTPTPEQTTQAIAHTTGRIVAERIRCEQRDLQGMLRYLKVDSAPAADSIAKMQADARAAMARDSHDLALTRYLHPSPSLRNASYDPAVRLIGN
jgi:hypothetical protein